MSCRTCLAAGALALLSALLTLPPSAAVAAVDREVGAGGRYVGGEAAVAALRSRLPAVAALNRTDPGRLVDVLRSDDTMRLDRTGRLVVVDRAPEQRPEAASAPVARFPFDETFRLHSRPGASRVLHLDFDGHLLSGTNWWALPEARQPAFDLDGDPATWSVTEHEVVQSVFARVAEDFAPFDVDVTTQDPGHPALHRSSAADLAYGTRVLITPSTSSHTMLCGGMCGGIAFVGVFDLIGSNTQAQPAWVFSHVMHGDAKYIAEAASHEAGHNLGLWHHGTADAEYYGGHGSWAPIMGVGYYQPLVQWSDGGYPHASNPDQDDVATVQQHGLPRRPDDHGSVLTASTSLGKEAAATTGVIEGRADVDVFTLKNKCDGPVDVTLEPAPTSPNLDARVRLSDRLGEVVRAQDPLSFSLSYDVAGGLGAAFTSRVAKGTFYVSVAGVGRAGGTDGYPDYGSLGAYSLELSPCSKR